MLNFKTGKLFESVPPLVLIGNQPQLSLWEKVVLRLIAEDMISKQIANKLYISVISLNTNRQRIIEKLNMANTGEAIRNGSEEG